MHCVTSHPEIIGVTRNSIFVIYTVVIVSIRVSGIGGRRLRINIITQANTIGYVGSITITNRQVPIVPHTVSFYIIQIQVCTGIYTSINQQLDCSCRGYIRVLRRTTRASPCNKISKWY